MGSTKINEKFFIIDSVIISSLMQILSQLQFFIQNYKQISGLIFCSAQEFLIFNIQNYFISAEIYSLQDISHYIFFSKPFYRKNLHGYR